MKPYAYFDGRSKLIQGPGFALMSEGIKYTPFYTEPLYEGQQPFACTHEGGMLLFYPHWLEDPKHKDILFPLYLEEENVTR
jgi:hypothetical protein